MPTPSASSPASSPATTFPHNYTKTKATTPSEAIAKAYKEVGGLIHGKATANRDFQGMGTTCSTLILLPDGALIAHVGDSRVYRVRNGRIDQLSFDHSLAWELVRRNHLSAEQAYKAVPRNVITRSLGPDPNIEVDIEGPLPVEPATSSCSAPTASPALSRTTNWGPSPANFHPKNACRYLHPAGQPPGGAGQHHRRHRPDRPLGRPRHRRTPQARRRPTARPMARRPAG